MFLPPPSYLVFSLCSCERRKPWGLLLGGSAVWWETLLFHGHVSGLSRDEGGLLCGMHES